MTKAMGLQEMYPKMNGTYVPKRRPCVNADCSAMEPEEAAVPFTEFMEKVDMSMTGKLWAPSMYTLSLLQGGKLTV
jgi:hypothetical protein